MKRARGPRKRKPVVQTVEMADGRVYSSQDAWKTIYLVTPAGRQLVEDKQEADMARFIAVHAS